MRRPHHAANLAALIVGLVVVSACSPTTYDESLVETTVAATTTTLPSGAAAELLPRLEAEATGITGLMIDGGDAGGAAERIEALWAAARDEVSAARFDLVAGFDDAVIEFAEAVQYKRAADADKAARNITALVDAFLA